jgi:hypothetical protein
MTMTLKEHVNFLAATLAWAAIAAFFANLAIDSDWNWDPAFQFPGLFAGMMAAGIAARWVDLTQSLNRTAYFAKLSKS